MGWFWADSAPAADVPRQRVPHPPNMSGTPPPGCPMHQSSPSSLPSEATISKPPTLATPPSSSSCPVVGHGGDNGPATKPWSERLNPLNMMPTFSQTRAEGQEYDLPTNRTISTIPKGNNPNDGFWEYPSPQQMYNAMVRKGHDGQADNAVVSMVDVHNFLNEGAWEEIMTWEQQFGGGVARGWRIAMKGGRLDKDDAIYAEPPRLLRFQGRPQEPTPKARMLQLLSRAFPDTFGTPPPFDRHDWYILRFPPTDPNATNTSSPEPSERRYVIDYYEAPPEPTGEPVFYLDVRPAIDSPSALLERTLRWGGETWWKATGASVREEMKKQKMLEKENFA